MPMRGEMVHPMVQNNSRNYYFEELVQTTLPPEQLLPTYYQSAGAVIFLSRSDFSDKYGHFFKEDVPQHNLGLLSREELLPEAEMGAKAGERASREWAKLGAEQRAAINMTQGFNILLTATTESNICSVLVGTPAKDKSNALGDGEGMRMEWRGLMVFFPTDDGAALDMAFLVATGPVLGWRAGISPQEGNRALEYVAMLWKTWKERGYPQPSSYRPIAFPSFRFPPIPGVLVTRPNYSLVL
jgi:hypothetical protein